MRSSALTLSPPLPQSPLRLLLLEDSRLDARIIEAQLARAIPHFELVRTDSRDEFLAALGDGHFDLILSDYRVPGFEGEEALTLAAERCPHTPFIFVSGAIGEHTAIDLLKRGATDYVLKDRLERLVPSVERALRERAEINERQRAERALRERERTLSTLIGNLPGMAFRREPQPPFRLTFASDGCVALCGHTAETLARADAVLCDGERGGWAALIHPEDLPGFVQAHEDAVREGRQLTATYRIRAAGGEQRWVWERSTPQRRADGTVEALEGFATDITQQKGAEEALRARVEFEQQLIGIVSHDLRNPLNAITLVASMLLRREGLDDGGTVSVRRILASAERAGRMIRDLLDFTQVRLGEGLPLFPRPCDLRAVLAGVVEEVETAHPLRRVTLEGARAPVEGTWDPDRVAQAFGNLLTNAVAYSPPESAVTAKLELVSDDRVAFTVHNGGAPIPAERLPHLFRPLSRGARDIGLQTRSIGLGLFIVKSIAQAHGGTVSVRSSEAEGTVFTLTLPRHVQAPRGTP